MRPRILVVEDEENVAFVVCTALRLAGYTTVETTSGRDALQVVSADEEFDLIVLDAPPDWRRGVPSSLTKPKGRWRWNAGRKERQC